MIRHLLPTGKRGARPLAAALGAGLVIWVGLAAAMVARSAVSAPDDHLLLRQLNLDSEVSVANWLAGGITALLALAALLHGAMMARERKLATGLAWLLLAGAAGVLAALEATGAAGGNSLVQAITGASSRSVANWGLILAAGAIGIGAGALAFTSLRSTWARVAVLGALAAWAVGIALEASAALLFDDRASDVEIAFEESAELLGTLLLAAAIAWSVLQYGARVKLRQAHLLTPGIGLVAMFTAVMLVAVILGGFLWRVPLNAPTETEIWVGPILDGEAVVQALRWPEVPVQEVEVYVAYRSPRDEPGWLLLRINDPTDGGRTVAAVRQALTPGFHLDPVVLELAAPLNMPGRSLQLELSAAIETEGHLQFGATREEITFAKQFWANGVRAPSDQTLQLRLRAPATPGLTKLRAIGSAVSSDPTWVALWIALGFATMVLVTASAIAVRLVLLIGRHTTA